MTEHKSKNSMNKFNPKKLLLSKWTAIEPINKEKHFIVIKSEWDEENQIVINCTLESVMTKNQYVIEPNVLQNNQAWLQGWK